MVTVGEECIARLLPAFEGIYLKPRIFQILPDTFTQCVLIFEQEYFHRISPSFLLSRLFSKITSINSSLVYPCKISRASSSNICLSCGGILPRIRIISLS
ncbi:hypothetical protein D1872_311930 [compost metagenome]